MDDSYYGLCSSSSAFVVFFFRVLRLLFGSEYVLRGDVALACDAACHGPTNGLS